MIYGLQTIPTTLISVFSVQFIKNRNKMRKKSDINDILSVNVFIQRRTFAQTFYIFGLRLSKEMVHNARRLALTWTIMLEGVL